MNLPSQVANLLKALCRKLKLITHYIGDLPAIMYDAKCFTKFIISDNFEDWSLEFVPRLSPAKIAF